MRKFLKNKKFVLLIFFLFLVLGFISVSFAQELETDWPPAPGGKDLTGASTLLDFIDYVYRWGMLIGSLAAFFALVFAGFKYLTSIGDPSKMSDAKERIIAALAGLILLLSTFLILNTINPDLTTLELPTTTVGGYGAGTFGSGPSNKPCLEVQFFKQTEYNGVPVAAYFKDPTKWNDLPFPDCNDASLCHNWGCLDCFLSPCPDPGVNCVSKIIPNTCLSIGSDDFWGVGGNDIPILSMKIDGDCVINTYSEGNCSGNQSSIFMSDPNASGDSKQDRHSIMLVDREAPSSPKVFNLGTLCPVAEVLKNNLSQWDSSATTCQVKLTGYIDSVGTPPNDFINLYILYGESPTKLYATWPPYEKETDPLWASITEPFGGWGNLKKVIKLSKNEIGNNATYTITGLDPDKTYYWTFKAVAGSGGKYDVDKTICKFRLNTTTCSMWVQKAL